MRLKPPISVRLSAWFWILNGAIGLILMIIALIGLAVDTIGNSEEFGWGAVIFAALVTLLLVGGLCTFFIWVGMGALRMRYPKGILRGNALGALLLGGLGVLSWFDMIGGPVTPSPPQGADQAVVAVAPEAEPSDATPPPSDVGTQEAPDAQKPFGELAISLGWVLSGLLAFSGATAYDAVRKGNQALSEQV